MPNRDQQGGMRDERSDQGQGHHEQRNQRSQRPQQAYRAEPQQDQRTAGGRSEAYAQQRDGEQLRAGYERQDWQRQEPRHNVRSEPHWDPTSARGTWDPAGSRAGTQGNWEDDRYHGSPAYGDEHARGRTFQDERSSSPGRYERGNDWHQESRYRNQQPQALGTGGYGVSEFRGERGFDSDHNQRATSHHDESLGQQLGDIGRRFVGKVKRIIRNPKNYTRSDERIREDVCDRLAVSAEVDPSEVEVTVTNGEVTLTGTVQNRQMKFQAEELADDVAGVHDVHNQLRVRRDQPGTSGQPSTSTDAQRGRPIGRS